VLIATNAANLLGMAVVNISKKRYLGLQMKIAASVNLIFEVMPATIFI
jgi:hypothetical protein